MHKKYLCTYKSHIFLYKTQFCMTLWVYKLSAKNTRRYIQPQKISIVLHIHNEVKEILKSDLNLNEGG